MDKKILLLDLLYQWPTYYIRLHLVISKSKQPCIFYGKCSDLKVFTSKYLDTRSVVRYFLDGYDVVNCYISH